MVISKISVKFLLATPMVTNGIAGDFGPQFHGLAETPVRSRLAPWPPDRHRQDSVGFGFALVSEVLSSVVMDLSGFVRP